MRSSVKLGYKSELNTIHYPPYVSLVVLVVLVCLMLMMMTTKTTTTTATMEATKSTMDIETKCRVVILINLLDSI